MKTAALLPTTGDPLLARYWVNNYRQKWQGEVDELRVLINGPTADAAQIYHDAGAKVTITGPMGHGQALNVLMAQTDADAVMLIEDDAFVRRPGVIGDAFAAIERGEADIIACPRDSYASESVVAAGRRRFGDEPLGLALWPCFLFTARAHLEATDRVFDSTLWDAGDAILGTTLDEPASADTFIWASYQLREMGLTIRLEEMHRVGEAIGPDAPWFHIGGLSSGHGWGWLNDWTPERYAQEIVNWADTPSAEIAKRMAWWQRAWDHWDGAIPEYHEAYGAGMRRFMADFRVDQREVDALRASFDYLVTWAES